MAKPTKLNTIWAVNGATVDPGDTKFELGWEAEIPPYQYFNYILNKHSAALGNLNTYGILEWDSATTYELGSKVMHSGLEYKCTAATSLNETPGVSADWLDVTLDQTLQTTSSPTFNGLTIAGTGVISARIGDNALNTLSKAVIGGVSGQMLLGAVGNDTFETAIIRQATSGTAVLNSPTGTEILLRKNNVTVGSITDTAFEFDNPVLIGGAVYDGSSSLIVNGSVKATNLVAGLGDIKSLLTIDKLEIGLGRTSSGNAIIDLVGDTVHTDYGLRIRRYDTGQNATSRLEHRGIGQFQLFSTENATIRLMGSSGTYGSFSNTEITLEKDTTVNGNITQTAGVISARAGESVLHDLGFARIGGYQGFAYFSHRNFNNLSGAAIVHLDAGTLLINSPTGAVTQFRKNNTSVGQITDTAFEFDNPVLIGGAVYQGTEELNVNGSSIFGGTATFNGTMFVNSTLNTIKDISIGNNTNDTPQIRFSVPDYDTLYIDKANDALRIVNSDLGYVNIEFKDNGDIISTGRASFTSTAITLEKDTTVNLDYVADRGLSAGGLNIVTDGAGSSDYGEASVFYRSSSSVNNNFRWKTGMGISQDGIQGISSYVIQDICTDPTFTTNKRNRMMFLHSGTISDYNIPLGTLIGSNLNGSEWDEESEFQVVGSTFSTGGIKKWNIHENSITIGQLISDMLSRLAVFTGSVLSGTVVSVNGGFSFAIGGAYVHLSQIKFSSGGAQFYGIEQDGTSFPTLFSQIYTTADTTNIKCSLSF